MRRILILLALAAALVPIAPDRGTAAPSSEIIYRVTRVRDAIWRYDYTLVNKATNPQNSAITLFETYFPYGSAQNIGSTLLQAADGWRAAASDPIAPIFLGPQKGGGNDFAGVYQATAKRPAKALRPGQSLSGFSVEFEWLGPQDPGEQDYLAIHTFDRETPGIGNPGHPGDPGHPGHPGDPGHPGHPGGHLPPGHPSPPGGHDGGGRTPPIPSYYEQGRSRLDPSVPEPATLALIGTGLVGLAVARIRRRSASR